MLLVGAFANDMSGETSLDKMYLKKQFVSPPLGLHRIAQMLREEFPIRVFDPNIESVYRFLDEHAPEYDLIGVSLTHPTLENDLSILWHAQKNNPEALLIAGGEEAFFNWKDVIDYSPAQVCIQGEGEFPLRAVGQKMAEFIDQPRATLLEALKTTAGCIIRDGDTAVVGPLNPSLPPDVFQQATVEMGFENIPYEKYWEFMDGFFEKQNEETFKQTIPFASSSRTTVPCAALSAARPTS